MATYEKKLLSGSVQGEAISLGSSASTITLHQTGTSNTVLDEVWIYLTSNNPYVDGDIIININGAPFPPINLPVIGGTGLLLVIPGLVFSGSGSAGSTITAIDNGYSGGVYALGYVNRITP